MRVHQKRYLSNFAFVEERREQRMAERREQRKEKKRQEKRDKAKGKSKKVGRPKKGSTRKDNYRSKYTPEQMDAAVTLVLEEGYSLAGAALECPG